MQLTKDKTKEGKEFPCLETPRLFLREVQMEDTDALFENYTDHRMVEYFMDPVNKREDAEAIAREYISYFRESRGIVWAVTLRSEGKLLGTCGYEKLSLYDRRGEIGYDLNPKYWGLGLMKEAVVAVVNHSIQKMGLNRIEALVLAGNQRSINLLTSLNFQVEGTLREHRWFRGKLWDNILLSLLSKDWQS